MVHYRKYQFKAKVRGRTIGRTAAGLGRHTDVITFQCILESSKHPWQNTPPAFHQYLHINFMKGGLNKAPRPFSFHYGSFPAAVRAPLRHRRDLWLTRIYCFSPFGGFPRSFFLVLASPFRPLLLCRFGCVLFRVRRPQRIPEYRRPKNTVNATCLFGDAVLFSMCRTYLIYSYFDLSMSL